LLINEGVTSILGNHDLDILNKRFKVSGNEKCPKEWNFNNLSTESLTYLRNLPHTITAKHNNHSVLICHGSPSSITEYLREDSIEADVAMASIAHDVLICGHTHLPYYKKYGPKVLINSGSVGKPKNGTPHATYVDVIFGETISVNIVEVEYSFHKTVENILQHDLPDKNTLALIQGA